MWDWNVVGEVFLGLALGISVGGWVVIGFARGLIYELLSNSTVQRFSRAAEMLGKKGDEGPWWAKPALKIGEKLGVLDKD